MSQIHCSIEDHYYCDISNFSNTELEKEDSKCNQCLEKYRYCFLEKHYCEITNFTDDELETDEPFCNQCLEKDRYCTLGEHNCKVKDFTKTEKKRCRVCFKKYSGEKKDAAKKIREENENEDTQEDEILLDKEETDLTCRDWQGGKHSGSVFIRPGIASWTLGGFGKQESFNFGTDSNKKTVMYKKAIEMQKTKSLEQNKTTNRYKIIFDDITNVPRYIIVQLFHKEETYVTLCDISNLELIKKFDLGITFSGKKTGTSKDMKYCQLSSNYKSDRFHKYILDIKDNNKNLGDHINGYPLDNRKENLRSTTFSENNKNRTWITDTYYYQKNEEEYEGVIIYSDFSRKFERISITKTFPDIEGCKNWIYEERQFLDRCALKNIYIRWTEIKKVGNNKFTGKIDFIDWSTGGKKEETSDIFDSMQECNEKWVLPRCEEISSDFITYRENLRNEYETIMVTHAPDFKWNDIEPLERKKSDVANLRSRDEVQAEQRAIYNQFQDIYPEWQVPEYFFLSLNLQHIIYKNTDYKYCFRCGNWKIVQEFSKSKTKWDKLDCRCKKCDKTRKLLSNGNSNNNDDDDNNDNPKKKMKVN